MAQIQTSKAHSDSVVCEVVEKIAEVEDVDPLELTPPLFEVIDCDALDQIFSATRTGGRMEVQVAFSYNDYEVTVRSDGDVSVEE